jgi:hypothetical protein
MDACGVSGGAVVRSGFRGSKSSVSIPSAAVPETSGSDGKDVPTVSTNSLPARRYLIRTGSRAVV